MKRGTPPPEKLCAACGRRFAWRRKWARDWDQVRFCSDACRTGRYSRAREALGPAPAAAAKPR